MRGWIAAAGVWAIGAAHASPPPAAHIERPSSFVEVRALSRLVAGARGAVALEMTARPGYHLNDDFPIHFTTTVSKDLAFDQARFDRPDSSPLGPCATDAQHHCSARLEVGLTPKGAGRVSVAGTLAFAACDADHCVIEKVPVDVPLEIAAR